MDVTESPRISVIMATYNEEEDIRNSVESILTQTFEDFEFLIIDDDSTDRTKDIIKDFNDERIRIFHNERNMGLAYSLNRGIEHARGKYIARMDADERSKPSRFEQQVRVLEKEQRIHAVGCWYSIIGRDGEKISDITISQDRRFSVEDLLQNGPGIAHGSIMLRKESIQTVGCYRKAFTLAQDYDLWLRMAETFGPGFMSVVPEVLYERRLSADQMAKRPRQRIYSSYAKVCSHCRQEDTDEPLDELESRAATVDNREFTESERESMYQYLAGVQFFDQGDDSHARQRFLKSISHAPTNIRPWYKLLLSCFPVRIREMVVENMQLILDKWTRTYRSS